MNVCSYHLQEAGATPVQELAYSLATAIGVLDAVRESGQVDEDRFPAVFASISFFVNSGIRFVEETAKMRAFTALWDRIGLERYGVTDPKARRFRYGVQVNSLGLTEAQPENNVQRIVLEMLGVTLSRDARARSIQLPAWNEALGLPRPWDQQWALRMQQVLAYETDLLEYPDLFEGSVVMERLTDELAEGAWAELEDVLALGGAFEAIDELKGRLVASHAERMRRLESGDLTVVGVNRFTEALPSPLEGEGSILRVDPAVEAETVADVAEWRADRDNDAVKRSLDELRRVAASERERHAGHHRPRPRRRHHRRVGRRAARGVRRVPRPHRRRGGRGGRRRERRAAGARRRGSRRCPGARRGCSWPSPASTATATAPSRSPSRRATPAWRSSTRASGSPRSRSRPWRSTRTSTSSACRSSPAATSSWCPRSCACAASGASTAPVVAGGIIPEDDRPRLLAADVAAVYTPKDFELTRIMGEIVDLAIARRG